MRIASVQFDASCESIEENFAQISHWSKRAFEKDVDILIFPELIDHGYRLKNFAEKPLTTWFQYQSQLEELAQQHNQHIILGGATAHKNNVYNSLFHVSTTTVLKAIYNKEYLFLGENDFFSAGESPPFVIKIEDINIATTICFDLRFPEHFRSFDNIPEVFIVAAAWPKSRIKQWTLLLQSRAIENQAYIVASNRIGTDDTLEFGGHSQIISPTGEILSSLDSNTPGIVSEKLDIDSLKKYRKSFPVLEHRKS